MNRVRSQFGAVMTAMATPFSKDGSVDSKAISEVASHLARTGSTAIVSTGTTGESGTLTDQERIRVWRETVDSTDLPVIVGSGSNDTAHSVELTKLASGIGAKGVLAVVPYYSRPSQSGIFEHFAAMAEATDLPIVIYDIPIRTGRKLDHQTLLELLDRYKNVVALKEASGEVLAAAELLQNAPDGFAIYSGDDGLTLPLLAVGAVGVIGVATHWAGQLFAMMIDAYTSGRVAEAAEFNRALIGSYRFESQLDAPNPIPLKAVLSVLGLSEPRCRLPISNPTPELIEQAAMMLDQLESDCSKLGVVLQRGVAESWQHK